VPPEALQLPVYATPTSAVSGAVHVSDTADTTKFVTDWLFDCPALSLTFRLNVYVPVVVGVPVMAPLDALMLSQLGELPLTEYLYGGVPPAALQLPVYATPTSAVSGTLHVNVTEETTKFVTAWVAVCALLSLTFKLNV
jgi:hypothetical protein